MPGWITCAGIGRSGIGSLYVLSPIGDLDIRSEGEVFESNAERMIVDWASISRPREGRGQSTWFCNFSQVNGVMDTAIYLSIEIFVSLRMRRLFYTIF